MPRPARLFTGQWADLPFEQVAAKAGEWGFDGLEPACWGDHIDVVQTLSDPGYAAGRASILGRHRSGRCVGAHLAPRHKPTLPPERWGDGEPEGVRQRAAERMKDVARAAAQLG